MTSAAVWPFVNTVLLLICITLLLWCVHILSGRAAVVRRFVDEVLDHKEPPEQGPSDGS